MDIKDLEFNARSLAEHIVREAPPDVAAIVVMVDRTTGNVVSRAARMNKDIYRAALRCLLDKEPPPEGIITQ
jgi:hypothetical protein